MPKDLNVIVVEVVSELTGGNPNLSVSVDDVVRALASLNEGWVRLIIEAQITAGRLRAPAPNRVQLGLSDAASEP